MSAATIVFVLELIGTVAFSISGSLIAIRCSLDLFGVLVLGIISAVGGGIVRDLFLGNFPPQVFFDWIIPLVAAATSLSVFLICYFNAKKFEMLENRIESFNNFFDAVGLATFSVLGTEATIQSGFNNMVIFSVSMGVVSGIGGGILRDILVDKTPYVLKKHIYALASVLGSLTYYFIRIYISKTLAIAVSILIIVIIRVLSAKYRLNLPKIILRGEMK